MHAVCLDILSKEGNILAERKIILQCRLHVCNTCYNSFALVEYL